MTYKSTPTKLYTDRPKGDLYAVFATGYPMSDTYRVSEPVNWDEAQNRWNELDADRRKGLIPQTKFFEVRQVWPGEDRPIVGPEIHSHDRYDKAPIDYCLTHRVVNRRGFKQETDAARRAWKLYVQGLGDTREQGRGGWFYWPNGHTAAQGLRDLARLCIQKGFIFQGLDCRWYVDAFVLGYHKAAA